MSVKFDFPTEQYKLTFERWIATAGDDVTNLWIPQYHKTFKVTGKLKFSIYISQLQK